MSKHTTITCDGCKNNIKSFEFFWEMKAYNDSILNLPDLHFCSALCVKKYFEYVKFPQNEECKHESDGNSYGYEWSPYYKCKKCGEFYR